MRGFFFPFSYKNYIVFLQMPFLRHSNGFSYGIFVIKKNKISCFYLCKNCKFQRKHQQGKVNEREGEKAIE